MKWLYRGKSIAISVILLGLCLLPIVATPLVSAQPADYYHLVVLSDTYLPVRDQVVRDTAKQQKIIKAKEDSNSRGRWLATSMSHQTEYGFAAF